jgi:guanylate kinase
MGKIMYCAHPTRLHQDPRLRRKIMGIARKNGFAPVNPFDCGAFEDFEGGSIGRAKTLEFLIHIMRGCDSVGVFGISDGVMGELKDALERGQDVRVFPGLDPEWNSQYEDLRAQYGDLFAELRGKNTLIVLVGPTAVGKTFWMDRLLEHCGSKLGKVKNTTTRQPRGREDHSNYNFVTKRQFQDGIRDGAFLEHDKYLGDYYGSSTADIRSVLENRSGIFAITPSGAKALWDRRFEINLCIINMLPIHSDILRKHFDSRGIDDPKKRTRLLRIARGFRLPKQIDHHTVLITDDIEADGQALWTIIEPLIE